MAVNKPFWPGLGNAGREYVPRRLPCGVEANRNYRPGKPMECCRTVCPDKSDKAIEQCYEWHKYNARKGE